MDNFMTDLMFATPGAVLDTSSLAYGADFTYQHALGTTFDYTVGAPENTCGTLTDTYGCPLDASKDYLRDYMPPPCAYNPEDTRTEAQKQDSRELEAMVAWMDARNARESTQRQARG